MELITPDKGIIPFVSPSGDEMVIITDGEDFDLEELHEMHANDTDHKVIMIKKHVITED